MFSLHDIAEATAGTVSGGDVQVRGVCTDTRAIEPGNLFVALTGSRFDGHRYADQAADRGASALLLQQPVPCALPCVKVPDTTVALGDLAAYHRKKWRDAHSGRRIVAIGGSVGKTTTRRAIEGVLRQALGAALHATRANQNNLIGVPLTLLAAENFHQFIVLELGTSIRGELPRLSEMVRPDVGILTQIALEHVEGLGGLEEIEAEESAVLASARQGVGCADDPRVHKFVRWMGGMLYGRHRASDYRLMQVENSGWQGQTMEVHRPTGVLRFQTPLLGEAGLQASLAAVAAAEVALRRPLLVDEVQKGLSAAQAQDGRMSVLQLSDRTTVVDDSYNANPVSMRASLRDVAALARAQERRLILVLGEMRELGDVSVSEHRKLVEAIVAVGPAALVAVAGHARLWVEPVQEANLLAVFASDAEEAAHLLMQHAKPEDVVLLKASRAIQLDCTLRTWMQLRA